MIASDALAAEGDRRARHCFNAIALKTVQGDKVQAYAPDGTVESYLYDGRGSVAQVYATPGAVAEGPGASFPDYPIAPAAGGATAATPAAAGLAPAPTAASLAGLQGGIASSLRYDPFGGITSGADPNALAFAYNAEERNPVTGLDYLRARYYDPATASFLTKDMETGSPASLNSQNRYAYAEADPVGNADPSGHSITGNPYERQMEGMGGINEIYNLYVGKTLQNSYAQASSAFYSRLDYAYGVDYRSIAAINSISQIPQAVADYYIGQGAAMARAVGQSWGCSPGALANAAIGSFAADVNATKDSVNSQIAAVKDNKYYQYQQYQEYLAYLAYVAEMARQAQEAAASAEAAALAAGQARAVATGNAALAALAGIAGRVLSNATAQSYPALAAAAVAAAAAASAAAAVAAAAYGGYSIPAFSRQDWARALSPAPAPTPTYSLRDIPVSSYNPSAHNPNYKPSDKPTADTRDSIHLLFDMMGLVPLIGEVFDAANALIYIGEGDWLDAGLSAAGLLPVGGQAATGARYAIKAGKAADAGKVAAKTADDVADAAKAADAATGAGKAIKAANPDGLPINDEITGWTNHGAEQALSRDGGIGVSNNAINDAVSNPIQPPIPQSNGTIKYVGKDATVVLNQNGKVVTTWANGATGTR